MNKLTAIAIFAAAFTLPATTHAEDAVPTPDVVPAPVVTATVDCNTFDITVTGVPENTPVYAEAGAEQFIVDIRQGHGALTIGVAEQGTVFFAAVGVRIDGKVIWPFQQWVDCTSTSKVAVPQMDDPEPVKAGLVLSVPEAPSAVEVVEMVETVVFGNYQMAPPES